MTADKKQLTLEIENILKTGKKLLEKEVENENPNSTPAVEETEFHEFRVAAISWLARVFGEGHVISKTFVNEVTHATVSRTKRAIGILEAAKKELQGEWLETTGGMLAKDMLQDLLRTAQSQLREKHLRSAVLQCGALIDLTLHRLCLKAGISLVNDKVEGRPLAKKALQLTGELYKKKVYDRQQNKLLIASIEFYNEVSKDDSELPEPKRVEKMLKESALFLRSVKL